MAGDIWNRVKARIGLGSSGASGDAGNLPVAKIRNHFKGLAKENSRFPQQISDYITDGDMPSLLLDLQNTSAPVIWRAQSRIYPPRDSSALFTNLQDWRVDQMVRLGEVLAVLEPINFHWGFIGSKNSPDWLRHVVTIWLGHGRKDQPVATLLALANFGNLGMPAVLDIVFNGGHDYHSYTHSRDRFAGVFELLEAEHELIVAAMPTIHADVRTILVAAIGQFGLQSAYLPMLLDAAIGSAKKVRRAARQALTGGDKSALSDSIATRFAKATPGQRAEMVDMVAETLGDAAPALLARLREGETAAKVLATFNRNSGAVAPSLAKAEIRPDNAEGYTAVDRTWVELPPLDAEPQATKFDRDVLKLLQPAADEFNRQLAAGKRDAKIMQWHWSKQYKPVDAATLENFAKLAEGTYRISPNQTAVAWLNSRQFDNALLTRFFDDPRLTLRHLVRIGVATLHGGFWNIFNEWSGPVGQVLAHRIENGVCIRTVINMWIENGGGDFIVGHLSQRYYYPISNISIQFWPALVGHFPQIDEALGIVPQSGGVLLSPLAGMELLGYLPKLPERYRSRLMLLANDSSARIRDRARDLLQGAPNIGGAIALQLADGRQEVRALAADWLAKRGERGEAPALRKAITKERSDLARAAMISALQRMGEDVADYFDPANMVKEAQAGVAKLKIKSLDWLPFDRMPALQWADGTPVDPVLPRWWIMLAAKLKAPGGNALMNLWLERLAPGDANRLGWMVLAGWIDEDTRRPTDEEANAFAAAHVDAQLQQNISNVRRWPASADYFPTDRAILFARLKAQKTGAYLSSAADSKGVLALTSRVNGADAAQRVRMFLKDHGSRVSQAKALLDALGANGSGAALQVVLAAANRSKQKSVQAHAAALIEDIAERNGWTAAQLADRTVPTGGFDSDGTLDLDCGEGRGYVARLSAEDTVVLFNMDGREVKALPGPRVDDERPAVEAAKKLLSAARKEVKLVLTAQTERLQEAMCLQRTWSREDWESIVIGHPLVSRIACRLVWQGVDDNGDAQSSFRPLGDGSYSDASDGDVSLDGFAAIRLVHSSILDADAVTAWRTHLADYAVQSPFDQIGRELPRLPDTMRQSRAVTDREGWIIETFKLRGIATKLGYQRGPAQDGGWFMTYEKTFREAELLVEIEFTGSPLPEENRNAALQTLCFRRVRGSGQGGGQVALGDVPPVLLAECWRDLHDIADKGTGYDADWKTRAYS